MRPTLDLRTLGATRPREYALRYLFGGIVTVGTGLITHAYGPSIGGLFLAFPAILPASLTLVKRHDGRCEAASAARGACLGGVALSVFAVVALATTRAHWPSSAALGAATTVWMITAVGLWFLAIKLHAKLSVRRRTRT